MNELSLDGQFKDVDSFLDDLNNLLPIIKIIENLEFTLFKNNLFFDSAITSKKKLKDIMYLRDDRIRKIKSFLVKLSTNPPYWNDTQEHNCSDTYLYNSINICETSLAETCERDKVILSFNHSDFLNPSLDVQKNTIDLSIYNILDKNHFLDYIYRVNEINILTYCNEKFKKTNLDFSLLENDYGFDILDANQKNEFLISFKMFTNMTWENINASDGLEYKKYNKPSKKKKGWFREGVYKDTDIYKFRTTQGYRCFGYRKENTFYILRFEIDHSISDNG